MKWSASLAWLVLAVFVVAWVVVFDLHAKFTGGQTMSGQFHDWIINPTIGPIIFGVWFGIFVGLTFHWFQYKGE